MKKIFTEEQKACKEEKPIARDQLLAEHQRMKAERLRIKSEIKEQMDRLKIIDQTMSEEEKKKLEEMEKKKKEERKKRHEERLRKREQRRKDAQESFMRDERKFISELKPPYRGLKGKWIRCSELGDREVLKSFGIFICTGCKKLWFSAHAISIYKQACKECTKTFVLPRYMWKNDKDEEKHIDDDSKTDRKRSKNRNHRKELCQACQEGKCTY